MIWIWLERAAWLVLAARIGFHCTRMWREDEDVGQVFANAFLGVLCVLFAVTGPVGGIIPAIVMLAISVSPRGWADRLLQKWSKRAPEKIGTPTQESDKQLKE